MGAAIVISEIDGKTFALGLLIIFIGVLFRSLAVVLSAYEKKFKFKEKLFMVFVWLPKSTV